MNYFTMFPLIDTIVTKQIIKGISANNTFCILEMTVITLLIFVLR